MHQILSIRQKGIEAYQGQDWKEAYELFSLAAKMEDADSQYYLGAMYMNGYYVEESWEMTIYWFKKSAQNGNSSAQKYYKQLKQYPQLQQYFDD